MVILKYQKKFHKQVIHAAVEALKQGKVVAYPTDTSYGLAADATNLKAVKKLYRVKERQFTKPVHIIPPSLAYVRRIGVWNAAAKKLAAAFWPGPFTIILPYRGDDEVLKKLGAKSGTVGIRIPKHMVACGMASVLKRPITTTSANPSAHISGGYDSYSPEDVISQFRDKKHKPDLVLDAGKLPSRKPSTIVKIEGDNFTILRQGPISEKQILKVLGVKV